MMTMTVFNIHEAKTRMSELIARVEAGEEIVIARHNVPVAKVVPLQGALGKEKAPVTAAGGFGEEAQMGLTGMDEPHRSEPGSFAPARTPGRFAHLAANLPPNLFSEPLDEDELAAWEGKYSGPSNP